MESFNPYQVSSAANRASRWSRADLPTSRPRPLVAAGFVAASVVLSVTHFLAHLFGRDVPGEDWSYVPFAWLMSIIAAIVSRGSLISPLACFLALASCGVAFRFLGGPVDLAFFLSFSAASSIPSLVMSSFVRRDFAKQEAAAPHDVG